MKTYTKLFIAGIILFIVPLVITKLLSMFCFAAGFILLICKGITEITNKNNAPHRDKSNTPPWEK